MKLGKRSPSLDDLFSMSVFAHKSTSFVVTQDYDGEKFRAIWDGSVSVDSNIQRNDNRNVYPNANNSGIL